MSLVTWYTVSSISWFIVYLESMFSFMIQHNMTWIYSSNGYICVYITFKSSYIWILVSQSFEISCKTLKSNKLSTLWDSFRAKSLSWPDQMYPVLSVVPSPLPGDSLLPLFCPLMFMSELRGNPEHMAMSQDASSTLFINQILLCF